jgi:hypothetical protein
MRPEALLTSQKEVSMNEAQMNDLKGFIEIVGTVIIILQAVTGIIIIRATRQLAKNEVELADLIRQAVDRIENDLPKK